MSVAGRVVVTWRRGEESPRRCAFTSACGVGRDLSNRILCNAPVVSRHHLELVPAPGGVMVRNISRQGAVEVDGVHLAAGAQRLLLVGETVRLGDMVIQVVEVPSQAAPAHVRCADSTCGRLVDATLSDCPWCGRSLACAQTHVPRRG